MQIRLQGSSEDHLVVCRRESRGRRIGTHLNGAKVSQESHYIHVLEAAIPTCSAESSGFGTRLGDQQYVIGTFSISVREGPSLILIGASWMLCLQALTTSPSLQPSRCQQGDLAGIVGNRKGSG